MIMNTKNLITLVNQITQMKNFKTTYTARLQEDKKPNRKK